jgi:hypothetical protein
LRMYLVQLRIAPKTPKPLLFGKTVLDV